MERKSVKIQKGNTNVREREQMKEESIIKFVALYEFILSEDYMTIPFY